MSVYFTIDDSRADIVMPKIKFCGEHLIPVTWQSPRTHRFAVYRFAQYFCREMGYDFVQYGYKGNEDDPHCTAYLWHGTYAGCYGRDHKHPCYGAACFRERDEGGPALQWIWIHPFLRRKGMLSGAWDMFEERHPRFAVEAPLSPAMLAFLEKRGHPEGIKGWCVEYFKRGSNP